MVAIASRPSLENKNRAASLILAPGLIHPGARATRAFLRVLGSVSSMAREDMRRREPLPAQRIRTLRAFGRRLPIDGPGESGPNAVVLYMHRQRAPQGWIESLRQYVREGGGLLAVHSAAASFKGDTAFGELIGGVFSGHGPVETFTVEPSDGWLAGEPFSVHDELYELVLTAEVTVHLRAVQAQAGPQPQAQAGRLGGEGNMPVCWTHRYGGGRVAYLSLGHTAGAFAVPEVARTIARLFRWVQGQEAGPDGESDSDGEPASDEEADSHGEPGSHGDARTHGEPSSYGEAGT